MKVRKSLSGKLLVEPAAVSTGDIVFNLIVFFLVCASTPRGGRQQDIPAAQENKTQEKKENTEILVTRTAAVLNGSAMKLEEVESRLKAHFRDKPKPEDRIVVLKTRPDTPYRNWIAVSTSVQDAGGSITIQREEEKTITVGQ